MKQFNLEEYLEDPNKKVVTRDGRNVRIVCTDSQEGDHPILMLCSASDGIVGCFSCFPNGRRYVDTDSCADLFFAPEKHEGWVNMYKTRSDGVQIGQIYSSKEEAEMSRNDASYISTAKIEWEE